MGKRQPAIARDLFGFHPAGPEGFDYREDVISPADEAALIGRFAELPFMPFEFHGWHGKRRVVSFGWRYDYGDRSLAESPPMPPFLLALRERAAAFAGTDPEGLQQVLINEYSPGAGIGWHRDKPMFEDVVAVSLGASCALRFRRKQRAGWERASQALFPRSAYVLRGPARWQWEHSILPIDRLRYSVTFRNFVEEQVRGRKPG